MSGAPSTRRAGNILWLGPHLIHRSDSPTHCSQECEAPPFGGIYFSIPRLATAELRIAESALPADEWFFSAHFRSIDAGGSKANLIAR